MPIDLNSILKKYGNSNSSTNQSQPEQDQPTEKPASTLDLNTILNKFKDKEINGNNSEKNKAIMNAALNQVKQDTNERLKQAALEDPDLKRLADIINSEEDIDIVEYSTLLEKAFHFMYEKRLKDKNNTINLFTIKKNRAKEELEKANNQTSKEKAISDYIFTLTKLYNVYALWDDMLENQLKGDIQHLNSLKSKAGLDTTNTLADIYQWQLDKQEENLADLKELPNLRKKYGYLTNKYDYGD